MRRKAGTRRPSACSRFQSRSTGAERRTDTVCRRPQSHLIGDAIASAWVFPVSGRHLPTKLNGHQPQDREGTRPRRADWTIRRCRRG
jgi:hypothetical protein